MIDAQSSTPQPVAVIGTGDGKINAETPEGSPDLIVRFVTPLVAVTVRFIHAYLLMLVGSVSAGMVSDLIPATDFLDLLGKCSMISFSGPALGVLKDLVTIFRRLEGKYPLLTGSI